MKNRYLALLLSLSGCLPLISACVSDQTPVITEPSISESTSVSSESVASSSSASSSSKSSSSSSSSSKKTGPEKVTVAAHTLQDSNVPIDLTHKDEYDQIIGERVGETTWNSFLHGSSSKFNGHYNFSYMAYVGGNLSQECFTKDGYMVSSFNSWLYYERKSGSTYYMYTSTNEGYLRSTTTLDIQQKYTYRITEEIKVHMFDFEHYEFEEEEGIYYYIDNGFSAQAKFLNGYLVYLYYITGMNVFKINAVFETTINIPKSYYYE